MLFKGETKLRFSLLHHVGTITLRVVSCLDAYGVIRTLLGFVLLSLLLTLSAVLPSSTHVQTAVCFYGPLQLEISSVEYKGPFLRTQKRRHKFKFMVDFGG